MSNLIKIETLKEFIKPCVDFWNNSYVRLYFYPKTNEAILYMPVKTTLKNNIEVEYYQVFNATGLINVVGISDIKKDMFVFHFHHDCNFISALKILSITKNMFIKIDYWRNNSCQNLIEADLNRETLFINLINDKTFKLKYQLRSDNIYKHNSTRIFNPESYDSDIKIQFKGDF